MRKGLADKACSFLRVKACGVDDEIIQLRIVPADMVIALQVIPARAIAGNDLGCGSLQWDVVLKRNPLSAQPGRSDDFNVQHIRTSAQDDLSSPTDDDDVPLFCHFQHHFFDCLVISQARLGGRMQS